MTNLFKGWEKDNIAVAVEKTDNTDFTICEKYYQLGFQECKQRFPFNLLQHDSKIKSGHAAEIKRRLPDDKNSLSKSSRLQIIYLSILQYTGIIHYKNKFVISNELLNWIDDFSPDVIYSMLSSMELIRFVIDLNKKTNVPVAIHIMDDWPTTISSNQISPLKYYWKYRVDKEFRKLISKSKYLLSISEAMSDEYYRRYGFYFQPFHNPIDIKFWSAYSRSDYERNEVFTILYAGRIGTGLKKCLLDLAKAINNLVMRGYNIEFRIQSTTNSPILNELIRYAFVKLNEVAPYNELPKIFSKADLLLLPNDFDRKSVRFLKYSMPTKASEYMVSGSPILVYSSLESAVTKHALKYNWAYVVSDNSTVKLEKAIIELYENPELRKRLGNTARSFAISNYDDSIVRDQFRKYLISD